MNKMQWKPQNYPCCIQFNWYIIIIIIIIIIRVVVVHVLYENTWIFVYLCVIKWYEIHLKFK
jgi:hypothetical protein